MAAGLSSPAGVAVLALDPPLAAVAIAAALHLLGERRIASTRSPARATLARNRAICFYAGLLVVYGALGTPLDTGAHRLLWVHMVQHILLMTVAAPLIVLGAPWSSIWRALPLGARRGTARTVGMSRWWAPLRALARWLGRPTGTWLAYTVNLAVWHVPPLYDLTLANQAVHDLEHTLFLVFGALLWAQALRSAPLRLRLDQLQRVYYVLAAMTVNWLLSIVLAFYPTPLYAAYATLHPRPEGISALADQQLAAGMMLGPGSIPMTIFIFVGLYRWLGGGERQPRLVARG